MVETFLPNSVTVENCLQSMFNKAMGLRPVTLLKKEITAQLHSCEVCYIFQNSFFVEILRVTASQTNLSFPLCQWWQKISTVWSWISCTWGGTIVHEIIRHAKFFYDFCFLNGEIIVIFKHDPNSIYLYKVNNRNTRKKCEICSKLTINTPERRLMFLFLTLNMFHRFF